MFSLLDATGSLGRGSFAVRFVLTLAVAAGLIAGSLHYVGKVWPHAYQLKQLAVKEREAAMRGGKKAAGAEGHAPAAGAPAASAPAAAEHAQPAAAATTTPAAATGVPGETAAKPVGPPGTPLPQGIQSEPAHDPSLGGFDRHAFGNLGIFVAIVIAAYTAPILLIQAVKRLRDMGWTSFWSMAIFVPGVNVLLLLALLFAPGRPGGAAHDGHAHAH